MRLDKMWKEYGSRAISIHAPLTGCDSSASGSLAKTPISIHAPLTGCDFGMFTDNVDVTSFQSTHPLRDATWNCNYTG